MDKRKHSRLPTHLHAVVVCPRFGLFRGSVENLSSDGLYVRTHNVNMCIDVPVTLTLQGDDRMPAGGCEVKGVVVHQDAEGFGVRFVDMEAACRARILELAGGARPSSFPRAEERVAI
ncbi:MAG TPA: PilZ domain-containing protein [Gammaproteobacteria bacterium]|nr:PilZ domain-containing protein [Gammaproteobacteria bacterium]